MMRDTIYPIEISGWDSNLEFFTEISTLEWSEGKVKRTYCGHNLRPGAILFVRLTHPPAARMTTPIPYLVESVVPCRPQGVRVLLTEISPRKEAPSRTELGG